MKKILYLDCFSGISGDMALGALLDLGLDAAALEAALRTLDVPGWSLALERRNKNGIHANYARVLLAEEHGHGHHHHDHDHDHNHDHEHEHEHNHEHKHEHRSYADIVALIEGSGITPRAKALAQEIFRRVAEAEAKVHGTTPEQVHFHEVGAVDSIVDIVGTAVLVDMLGVDAIYCSVVQDGHGFAHCQHGQIPVPVPAVVEIFAAEPKARTRQIDIPKELVTPTGAAIAAALSQRFGAMPEMRITRVGYGAGTRDLDIPNVLRAVLGEIDEENPEERVTILETQVDDCTPEILGYTMERLYAAGALEVFFTAVYMKKHRPGTLVTVLCAAEKADELTRLLLCETSTIGVRRREERRTILPRRMQAMHTAYGTLEAKVVALPGGGERAMPEYEQAAALARQHGVPLREVYRACAIASNAALSSGLTTK